MTPDDETIEIRRGDERSITRSPGIVTRHSFSFGDHYDPTNIRHGRLLTHDEHVIQSGAGFDVHQHRDVEVVSWVLEGVLMHRDSLGNDGFLRPDALQWMHAGAGIQHAETNCADVSSGEPVRVLQMWLTPILGDTPYVEHYDLGTSLAGGDLVMGLSWPAASLWIGRPASRQLITVPDAPAVHVYVARGSVVLDGGTDTLDPGDAARLSSAGSCRLVVEEDAEILVWASEEFTGRARLTCMPPQAL